MKKVTISELKNKLSAILATLQSSKRITILDRNRPIAVLYPADLEVDDDGRCSRLERAGLLEAGKGKIDQHILDEPPPTLTRAIDAVQLMLDDRRGGL